MTDSQVLDVAVIGGGPAGLMAAEGLSATGLSVAVYERMPTLGRKFLMAGWLGLEGVTIVGGGDLSDRLRDQP